MMAALGNLVTLLTDPQLLLAALTTLAVFGCAASLLQSIWVMLSSVVGKRTGLVVAAKRALPWCVVTGLCGFTAHILWIDHLAVFQPGPALTQVLYVRSAALKLILLGFLKSVVVAAVIALLFPVLMLTRRYVAHPALATMEQFWRRHAPKTALYLTYYALLMMIVSLTTNHEILARLPEVELVDLARNIQEDVIAQIVEMRGVLLQIFDFSS